MNLLKNKKKVLQKQVKEAKKKEVFRKNVIDVLMVIPYEEGKVNYKKDNYTTLRFPISMVTDVEAMNRNFRQMWITLAKNDPTLSKEFETYFRNAEIERKRIEKLMNKMAIKPDKLSQKIENKTKELENKDK